ncbi:hypothetical protein NECAME_12567 [Necator americanus]|uniref:Centromere protein S n=1 Tax=Necator americanus TaxID=51031 RepID=W2T189_NECAM|nr:hypothetical protein NECAME_12567 [Necator americanus]ETN75016.1 hypothetical protein NECAME_12567 [Necator americanus]
MEEDVFIKRTVTELQKSIQVSVLKTADTVAQHLSEDGAGQVQFHPDVIAQVSAMIWDTVCGDWTSDLLAFSSHAGRQAVNVSDVALLMRRNKQLLEIVSKAADVDLGDYERPTTKRQRSTNTNKTKGKRGNAGTSGTSTALNAPVECDGTLTPHSEVDGNSRLSFSTDVNQYVSVEQKTLAVMKPVFEDIHKDFGDDVMIIDALEKPTPHDKKDDLNKNVKDEDSFSESPAKNPCENVTTAVASHPHREVTMDSDEDDFCMFDMVRTKTLTTTHSARSDASVPLDSSSRSSRRSALYKTDPKGGVHVEEVAEERENEVKVANTPTKVSHEKKQPSPDLFNTPVKEHSDGFEDLFDIPDQSSGDQHHQSFLEPVKNEDVSSNRKSDGGWSVKFSEFSFFDDDSLEAVKPSCEQDTALTANVPEVPTAAASSSKSKARASSTTPRSSRVPASKCKSLPSNVATPKQLNSVGAVKRRLNKPQTTTPKRTSGPKSALKNKAEIGMKRSAPAVDEFDSDEEFFNLE